MLHAYREEQGLCPHVKNPAFHAGMVFTEDCESLSKAFQEAVWDGKTDERLDDGSSDIDSLDAFEYTIERDIRYLIE